MSQDQKTEQKSKDACSTCNTPTHGNHRFYLSNDKGYRELCEHCYRIACMPRLPYNVKIVYVEGS